MELSSYFVSARTNYRHHHHLVVVFQHDPARRQESTMGLVHLCQLLPRLGHEANFLYSSLALTRSPIQMATATGDDDAFYLFVQKQQIELLPSHLPHPAVSSRLEPGWRPGSVHITQSVSRRVQPRSGMYASRGSGSLSARCSGLLHR